MITTTVTCDVCGKRMGRSGARFEATAEVGGRQFDVILLVSADLDNDVRDICPECGGRAAVAGLGAMHLQTEFTPVAGTDEDPAYD